MTCLFMWDISPFKITFFKLISKPNQNDLTPHSMKWLTQRKKGISPVLWGNQRLTWAPPSRPQGRPVYKGSHSTLGGMWGPHAGVELDELGRPVVWTEGRESLRRAELEGEQEERRKRVESFVKSSNMSLVCVTVWGIVGTERVWFLFSFFLVSRPRGVFTAEFDLSPVVTKMDKRSTDKRQLHRQTQWQLFIVPNF